ncbi:MAG: hypothetical protein WD830_11780 [Chloroflexota bacterium]
MPSSPPVSGPTPDFAALYLAQVDGGGLSPRLAYYLWNCAVYLADTWRDNLDDPAELLAQLPPVAERLADRAWLERFIDCFEAVADRLGAGEVTYPGLAKCTGEEMALHLVIELAEAFTNDGVFADDLMAHRLPALGAPDSDFEAARDSLLPDHDVLALFDLALDGIEDSDAPENAQYRTVNLHPRKWFDPFE